MLFAFGLIVIYFVFLGIFIHKSKKNKKVGELLKGVYERKFN